MGFSDHSEPAVIEPKGKRMSTPSDPAATPGSPAQKQRKSRLTLYIGAAIVAAVGLAFAAPQVAVRFELGGEIFPAPASDDGCSAGCCQRDERHRPSRGHP